MAQHRTIPFAIRSWNLIKYSIQIASMTQNENICIWSRPLLRTFLFIMEWVVLIPVCARNYNQTLLSTMNNNDKIWVRCARRGQLDIERNQIKQCPLNFILGSLFRRNRDDKRSQFLDEIIELNMHFTWMLTVLVVFIWRANGISGIEKIHFDARFDPIPFVIASPAYTFSLLHHETAK